MPSLEPEGARTSDAPDIGLDLQDKSPSEDQTILSKEPDAQTSSEQLAVKPPSNNIDNDISPTADAATIQDNRRHSSNKRRSVSGMRGLMPLALSDAYSPSAGHKAEGYFAEDLAQDLERSTDLFTAKNMTAGAPAPAPVVATAEERTKRKHMSCPPGIRSSLFLPSQSASARVHSLGAIEERNAIVQFLDRQKRISEYTLSDVDSSSGTDTSAAAAPSVRYRGRSVTTAATSVGSMSLRHSPKASSSPLHGHSRTTSWIEIDSEFDSDGEPHAEHAPTESDIQGSTVTRASTPPDCETTLKAKYSDGDFKQGWSPQSDPDTRTHSLNISALTSRFNKDLPKLPDDIDPLRRTQSARVPRHRFSEPMLERHIPVPVPPKTISLSRSTKHLKDYPVRHSIEEVKEEEEEPVAVALSEILSERVPSDLSDEESFDADFDALFNFRDPDQESEPPSPAFQRPSSILIRPMLAASSKPNVQAWLNNTVQPFAHGTGDNDDLARAVPLPPDAIETLRVSIACFPETMLLSSSLTVETIRAYSRKVRHRNLDFRDLPSDTPRYGFHSAKRSLLKKVSSYKHGALAAAYRSREPVPATNGLHSSPSTTSIEAPRLWLPIKHVFGCSSDYICDALYAHIVAFNYISALVPRDSASPKPGQKGGRNSKDSENDDIPKKAAHLLGLANQTQGTSTSSIVSDTKSKASSLHRRLGKKLSLSRMSWTGIGNPLTIGTSQNSTQRQQGQQRSVQSQEQTARDIQAGLLRCITRLVATAKTMAETGSAEDRIMAETEVKDEDLHFMRSLFEIVRISEEVVI